MEHNSMEVAVIEKATADASNAQLLELNELQLAFVGGGSGEVVFG